MSRQSEISEMLKELANSIDSGTFGEGDDLSLQFVADDMEKIADRIIEMQDE